jgi:hypothetical protein
MKIKCHCRTCNEVFELDVDIKEILNKKKREEKFLELMIRLSENEHVKRVLNLILVFNPHDESL